MKKNILSVPRGSDRFFDLNGTPTSRDSNLTSPIGNAASLRGLAFQDHFSARPVLSVKRLRMSRSCFYL